MPVIAQRFDVRRPLPELWDLFQDVPQVVSCMPGAELTEQLGPDRFKGRLSVKLGPVSASFDGEATVEEVDASGHRAVIRGKGVDRRGGSRGSALITYELTGAGLSTTVDLSADVTLQGRLAQFGRTGLLEEVSKTLTGEFVACLEAKMSASTPEEAAATEAGNVKGIRLFFISLWRWLKSAFQRRRKRDRQAS